MLIDDHKTEARGTAFEFMLFRQIFWPTVHSTKALAIENMA
jgi:hypothetical protein